MNMASEEHIEMQTMGEEETPPTVSRSLFASKLSAFWNIVTSIDEKVNKSTFGRVFRLQGSGHPDEIAGANFSTEIRAGLTTFFTMAYIIAVNASMLADTGFDCPCDKPFDSMGNCANQDEWNVCYNEVKLDLITATAALSGMACILMGFLTNLPVALGPGMGLNAYFTYQVVGVKGRGSIPYQLALTAIFVEGWIFMFLALTGIRHWLVKIIPASIKTASGVGIGLFLTLIGMSYSSGIGLVTGAVTTPLAIGGCPPEDLSGSGMCTQHVMMNPKMWVGIVCGGLFTACLMAFRIKAAIVVGIALVSIVSWTRDSAVTYFPYTPEGQARWDFFHKGVAFHPIQHTLVKQQWDLSGVHASNFAIALFTFLYVDIIDCTATLYSMARFCNRVNKGDGDFPRSTMAYCVDAFCISIGSLIGCSPVTVFVESGAGIAEGGRTGLTACVTGACFLISLFFAPIFASIPPWATGSTLIIVGCLMIRQVRNINWNYIGDALPSFVTLTFIPFSYSVAYGLLAGLFTYTGLNLMIWVVMKVSGDSVVPMSYDQKEYWTWRPAGEKPWVVRLFTKGRFWDDKRGLKRNGGFPLTEGDDTASFVRHESPTLVEEEKFSTRAASPLPFRSLN
ncbi:permease family-domain-containing protein [Diplogelasinospora grovesii]|uniref:Permease family-domain-containing protein n=1 Tax=Diplogelasinospora grovesii TaxID=303347 RepID=A0AAN6N8K7_9PEZI|nr:permease family-domain-containing protein [Diplogelasinospora grovesii]